MLLTPSTVAILQQLFSDEIYFQILEYIINLTTHYNLDIHRMTRHYTLGTYTLTTDKAKL